MPVFVERKTYRRRRMADGARMLPILGGLLFCMPLLWAVGSPPKTTVTMLYLFVIWIALSVISAVISRHLHDDASGSQKDAENGGR